MMEKLPDYLNREEVEQILEIASRRSFRDYVDVRFKGERSFKSYGS